MLVLCRLCNVYSSLHCTFICRRCKRSSNEHNTRYSCRICHLLIYFQIDFKQNNVMLIPIKPELLALAFIFNKIKRGARFLRLLQVCVRKHIPQLLSIIYYRQVKYASIIWNFLRCLSERTNQDESK